ATTTTPRARSAPTSGSTSSSTPSIPARATVHRLQDPVGRSSRFVFDGRRPLAGPGRARERDPEPPGRLDPPPDQRRPGGDRGDRGGGDVHLGAGAEGRRRRGAPLLQARARSAAAAGAGRGGGLVGPGGPPSSHRGMN